MAIFLEVRSGSQAGSRIRLTPGQLVRIGRTKASDFAFADDPHMSGAHFTAEVILNDNDKESGARLVDLNSRNGLFLNGQRVSTVPVSNGDTVVAGETTFAVIVEDEEAAAQYSPRTAAFPAAQSVVESAVESTVQSPAQLAAAATMPPQADTPQDRLLALFREDFQPLYAVLDTARDIRILALLLHHKEECQSLYEGEQGLKLAQVAPYLVRLQKDSPLLETLVKEGWGKNWGVYLTSPSDLQEVRRHLRHFLQVKLPSGEQVYFRFYDPRVMRVFLPTCTPEDVTQFFGPIQNYLMEDENPKKLFRFVNTGKGSERMMIVLVDEVEPSPEAPRAETEPETATYLENPLTDEAK
jgi:hypothetical protein